MTSPTLMPEPLAADAVPSSVAQDVPSLPRPRFLIPCILFMVTLLSTTSVGMRYMYNFNLGRPPLSSDADILPFSWVLHHLDALASGLPFSLTLITILLAHEFGHFFACRAFGVNATLPYLLPAPSLSGSFGAVIALKSRVSSRAALITIGAMGPLAGFLAAVISVGIGLANSRYATYPTGLTAHVQLPLLIRATHAILTPHNDLSQLIPHPILTASWMGLLITALNLIPAGQLDGGHILYSISPTAHRICHRIVVVGLLTMGVFCWSGWVVWGLILMMPAMRHPRVPEDVSMKPKHYALFPACLAILICSAMYAPFQGFSLFEIVTKLPHRW